MAFDDAEMQMTRNSFFMFTMRPCQTLLSFLRMLEVLVMWLLLNGQRLDVFNEYNRQIALYLPCSHVCHP